MSSESAKVFSLTNHTIIFALFPVNSGAGEDGICEIEEVGEAFTEKVGADGTIVRSKTGSRLFKVTLKLMQTSAVNLFLSTLHTADRVAENGSGVAPFLLKDNGGSTVFAATASWVKKWPKLPIGKEAGTLEWELAADGVMFLGGS